MNDLASTPAARNALDDTVQLPALTRRGQQTPPSATAAVPDFAHIQRSDEFTALRSRQRGFIFPMSLGFFAWYMIYVLLAAYAHDFMSLKVFGEVNVAIILGLLQFVTTIVITGLYIRFADRQLDPQVAEIRRRAGVMNP